MKRIELEIVADNSQYIQSAKQVEQATTSMYNKSQQGQKREKGLIEDTVEAIKKLEERRKKAYSIEEVERYNKKLAEAKQTLAEYNKAGVEVEKTAKKQIKSTGSLLDIFKKMIVPLLTITAATKAFNAIMKSTQATGDLLTREMTGLKTALGELWRSIASGNLDQLGKRLKEAQQAGRDYATSMDLVGDKERELLIRQSEREIKLAELAKVYRNTALVGVEGYNKRKEAAEEFIKLTEEGEREAIELAELRLAAELKLASSISGLTDKEIKNNLKRAQYLDDNKQAVEAYINTVKKLAAEQAKTTFETTPEGGRVNTGFGGDPEIIKKYRAEIEATDPAIVKLAAEMKGWNELTDENRKKLTEALVAVNKARSDAEKSTIRANTAMELADRELAKAEDKTQADRIKQQEEFTKALLSLQDEFEQSQIEQLEGKDKIAAERDYQLKQIAMLRAHLESLGTLTEEHYQMLAALEDNVRTESLKKELDFEQEQIDATIEHGNTIRDLERQLQEEALDLLEDNQEEKLKLQIKFAEEDIKTLEALGTLTSQAEIAILKQRIQIWNKEIEDSKKETKSIWSLFGIDPDSDEAEAIKETISIMVDNVAGALDSIFSARVEDAERTRSLLEDQIGFTQDALEAEMELMKAGYASNVDAKRKELEELKKQREKALKDEEKAIKAQRALDTAMQVSSLISASADILKTTAKIPPPLGQILAIAAIGTMFAAFASAKVKSAAATKLAEGGVGTETGMITGRSHAEGGESFLKHVEVERGEMFGVLNRHASRKYGKAFTEIVNNFNRDNLVVDRPDVFNNVTVDVNQTNERLDKVEYQLIRLNRHFADRPDVRDLKDVRIEKRGNKTRIIRK